METGTFRVKVGLAQMLKGGVIMDVVTAEHAKIAEDAGACAVMALERVPSDIRKAKPPVSPWLLRVRNKWADAWPVSDAQHHFWTSHSYHRPILEVRPNTEQPHSSLVPDVHGRQRWRQRDYYYLD